MRTSNELAGITSVITGAAGLLGMQHAIALLSLGSDVALWDIEAQALGNVCANLQENFPNLKVHPQIVDVTSENEVEKAMNELLSSGYSPQILINNAAINYSPSQLEGSASRIENYDLEKWRLEIEVGLTGSFICSKIFGRQFIAKKSGVIINISSDLSVIAPDQRIYERSNITPSRQPMKPVGYSVIKTGLIGLTRYLATAWAPFNIRVNAISPGGVFDNQDKDFLEKIKTRIPLGRMAEKTEYQSAIQFLATNDSSYMTGHNLIIDGGRSVW